MLTCTSRTNAANLISSGVSLDKWKDVKFFDKLYKNVRSAYESVSSTKPQRGKSVSKATIDQACKALGVSPLRFQQPSQSYELDFGVTLTYFGSNADRRNMVLHRSLAMLNMLSLKSKGFGYPQAVPKRMEILVCEAPEPRIVLTNEEENDYDKLYENFLALRPSGITISERDYKLVAVLRNEEMGKLLCHELLHALDVGVQFDETGSYDPIGTEAYAETLATLYNICFMACETGYEQYLHNALQVERLYSMYICAKFVQLTSRQIRKTKRMQAYIGYYNLRAVLLHDGLHPEDISDLFYKNLEKMKQHVSKETIETITIEQARNNPCNHPSLLLGFTCIDLEYDPAPQP